jgi:hypothetical protein
MSAMMDLMPFSTSASLNKLGVVGGVSA